MLREARRAEAEAMLREAMGGRSGNAGDMDNLLSGAVKDFEPGTILDGHIVGFAGDDVVVEVGLKSEGLAPPTPHSSSSCIEVPA